MNMIFERISPFDIPLDKREVWARLGGIGAVSEEDIAAAFSEISSVATPAISSVDMRILVNNGECVSAEGLMVSGRDFAKTVSDCRTLGVLMVTLGAGVDRLILKKSAISLSEAFIYDAIASAMAESLADLAEATLVASREHTGRFSPGYGDMPLGMQSDIIRLLDGGRRMGVTLSESGLMSPKKSVTALIGIR